MSPYYASCPPTLRLQSSIAGLAARSRYDGDSHPVTTPATAQQPPAILFTTASGYCVPIDEQIAWRIVRAERVKAPAHGSNGGHHEDGTFEGLSIDSIVQSEGRRRVMRTKSEEIDYRTDKKTGRPRQAPSPRYADDSASEVAKLVRLPVHVLASTVETLQELHEQTSYGAWASQVVRGYRP